ncbi:MAG: DEAD/DEAH box helicase [Bacteroidota bacterium]
MKPAAGFAKYQLPDRVLIALQKQGFTSPTSVQEEVIPKVMQKLNLIVEAPTGTGKTAAYGVPIIKRLDLLKRRTEVLVMVPSRELAMQVARALRSFHDGDQLKVGEVYGGVSLEESISQVKATPHIMVAVPGRLRDIMTQAPLDFFWRNIKCLIIDEGDKLLEMGFQRDFDELRRHMRSTLQVCFFSATISDDAEFLIRERVTPVKTIRLDPRRVLDNIRFVTTEVKNGNRDGYLGGLLAVEEPEQALIFCGRRDELYGVLGFLRNSGYSAEGYYGAQSQEERANIFQRFKEGHIRFLVATDLAARGLDIAKLPAVINLSIPEELDFYLHRAGRTGRAGEPGTVYNLVKSGMEGAFLRNHHRFMDIPTTRLDLMPVNKADSQAEEENKWIKCHLSRGKKDKIRKGDVVGFLIHQASLKADEIGTITIYDNYSTVDLPQKGIEQLEGQPTLKIKGKTVKVRRMSLEELQRRDRAVKKLLKDRR